MLSFVARYALLLMLLAPASASAHPSEIIIARHAEKAGAYELCDMGTERAQALVHQYLGRGAAQSLFAPGQSPVAMMAITMHTIDTVSPVAQSWQMPVTAYTVIPKTGNKEQAEKIEENSRTQEAAHDVLTDPRYDGKIVVMIWEHQRIASAALEKKFAGQQITLRQLLHLDHVGAPETWPDQTYDYFWIVHFASTQPEPTSLDNVQQVFKAPFDDLPANKWGQPEPRHLAAGCRD
jgi:hypothetical protein